MNREKKCEGNPMSDETAAMSSIFLLIREAKLDKKWVHINPSLPLTFLKARNGPL